MSSKQSGLSRQYKKALAKIRREDSLVDLRDGRKNRNQTFTPKKGKGSYIRKSKYRLWD